MKEKISRKRRTSNQEELKEQQLASKVLIPILEVTQPVTSMSTQAKEKEERTDDIK